MFRTMALAILPLAVVVLLLPIAGDFGEIASLPEGVADVIPPGIVAHEQLISEWDPPTGGFAVS